MALFGKNGSFKWVTDRIEDIQKIAMSIIFVVGLGYTGIDYVSNKFITRVEAANYALQANVAKIDQELAGIQVVILQNELFNAKKIGIPQDEKRYYRTVDKRLFKLKIKMSILRADESDYAVPLWLQEK